jgi:hypothetical protein
MVRRKILATSRPGSARPGAAPDRCRACSGIARCQPSIRPRSVPISSIGPAPGGEGTRARHRHDLGSPGFLPPPGACYPALRRLGGRRPERYSVRTIECAGHVDGHRLELLGAVRAEAFEETIDGGRALSFAGPDNLGADVVDDRRDVLVVPSVRKLVDPDVFEAVEPVSRPQACRIQAGSVPGSDCAGIVSVTWAHSSGARSIPSHCEGERGVGRDRNST